MVLPNFFHQNSFSRFWDILKKKKEKNPLFSRTITMLDHTMYGKVKNQVVVGQADYNKYMYFVKGEGS